VCSARNMACSSSLLVALALPCSSRAAQVDNCAYMASGGAVEIDLSLLGAAMVRSLQPALHAPLCFSAADLIDGGLSGISGMCCALASGDDAAASACNNARRVPAPAQSLALLLAHGGEAVLTDHGSCGVSGMSAARCCTSPSASATCCTTTSTAATCSQPTVTTARRGSSMGAKLAPAPSFENLVLLLVMYACIALALFPHRPSSALVAMVGLYAALGGLDPWLAHRGGSSALVPNTARPALSGLPASTGQFDGAAVWPLARLDGDMVQGVCALELGLSPDFICVAAGGGMVKRNGSSAHPPQQSREAMMASIEALNNWAIIVWIACGLLQLCKCRHLRAQLVAQARLAAQAQVDARTAQQCQSQEQQRQARCHQQQQIELSELRETCERLRLEKHTERQRVHAMVARFNEAIEVLRHPQVKPVAMALLQSQQTGSAQSGVESVSRDPWQQQAQQAQGRLTKPPLNVSTVAAVTAMTDSAVTYDDDYLQYVLSQIDEDSDAYAVLTGRTMRRRRARGSRGGRRRRRVRAMCAENSPNDGHVSASPMAERLGSPVGESALHLESPVGESVLELPAPIDADDDATQPAVLEGSPPGSPRAAPFSPGGTSIAGYQPLTPGIAGRVRERHELARAGYSPFDPGIGGRVRARHEAARAAARDPVGVCHQVQSRHSSSSHISIPDGFGISSPLGPAYEPRDPWSAHDEAEYWRLLAIYGTSSAGGAEPSAGGAEPSAGGAEPSAGGATQQQDDDVICMV
jgi:hypothetical protein